MIRLVTDYLENTVKKYPNKAAFIDERRTITFTEIQVESYHIAMSLIEAGFWKQPILVYLDKCVECISAFEGVSYSGNFYSPVDTDMPIDRINKIIDKLQPVAVITDVVHSKKAERLMGNALVLVYENLMKNKIDIGIIQERIEHIIDTDVLYVLFTSGSTGIPKGVVVSHRGIIDLSEWISEELNFNSDSIMANQAPFYFSFAVYDIYQTLKCGATTYIVPQTLFSQPVKLMKYLDEKKINTIVWVPSILTYISTLKALGRPHISTLKNVFFGAEVFQTKHLNRWMDEYPDVRFVNLYGPTEVTDTCTWFEINRRFNNDEMLPIGQTCRNKDCFLLDENILVTKPGEMGEICMRGAGISYGYYNDPERTKEVFTQNPLQNAYCEYIYHTGDIGKYNELGEMVYVCRKDFQIKHRGRRIELGEIETAVSSIDGMEENCCLYDDKKLRIVLFYVGDIGENELIQQLRTLLPDYMIPGKRISLEVMPHNLNGKIDRQKLKIMMEAN